MPVYPVKRKGKVVRGKWLVRIHHKGEPRTWTVNGTKDQAHQYEAEKRAEYRLKSTLPPRVAPTFLDFSTTDYKVHAKRRLKAGTWRNRKYQVAMLAEYFGNTPIDRIGPAQIIAFQNHRLDQPGVNEAKVNDDCKALRAILGLAKDLELIDAVPKWKRLREPQKKGRVVPWTAAEVRALYASLALEAAGRLPDPEGKVRKQKRHKVPTTRPSLVPMVAVMINCGLRKGEVLALRWDSVDLDRGLLKIWPNADWRPKGNRPREVPIGDAVRPWLDVPESERTSPVWVFPSSRGSRFAGWPQRRFDAAREHAGLAGGPHHCRHTFASHFLLQVPDLYLLAQVLGHTHTRVTELYAHLMPEHLDRARGAVSIPVQPMAVGDHGPDTIEHGDPGKRGTSEG